MPANKTALRADFIFGSCAASERHQFTCLERRGIGKDSAVIAAIQRAIALKSKYNIRVINLSSAVRCFESYKTDPLCKAVEAAWKAGIVVVASAGNFGRSNALGNNGYGPSPLLATVLFVITVGAMKTKETQTTGDDEIASYSSKGPSIIDHVVKPDLVAPGNRILSLLVSDSSLQRPIPARL